MGLWNTFSVSSPTYNKLLMSQREHVTEKNQVVDKKLFIFVEITQ